MAPLVFSGVTAYHLESAVVKKGRGRVETIRYTKADQAALRRGVDPWEVRGFYQLLRAYPDYNRKALALAAPLVAEVRENTTTTLGELCRTKLTERRFRRLLASRDREDLVHQLRATVRILDRRANIDELIRLVNFWGDVARRRLAQDYFGGEDNDADE